eukprot:9500106-Pyramimonas_sp.AAC.1
MAPGGIVESPFCLRRGNVAGCSFAASLIRAFAMGAFDGIPGEPGRCYFDAYIDDLSLNATGLAKEVIGVICRGARALHAAVTRALLLEESLGSMVGTACTRVANLGSEFAAGRPVRAGKGRSAKMKALAAAALRKTRRLQGLGEVLGRKALRDFAAGPLAGAVRGSDFYGVSDSELLSLRRMA